MGTHRDRVSPAHMAGRKVQLLALLEECARLDKMCPSLGDLAARFEVGTATVHDLFVRLRDEDVIAWKVLHRVSGIGNVRVVTIRATGQQTLTPAPRGRPKRGRPGRPPKRQIQAHEATELDRAKTTLRRRGLIVFDAEITDGRAGRGFVKVDYRYWTPDQVIARAAELSGARL